MKQFGETVEGYSIPVLNEREIRASAGIMFLFLLISITQIACKQNFLMLKFFIIAFLIDFAIRVFIGPKFSPTLILGRLIVSKQVPEYVGAPQKKFAWIIGFTLALIMFIFMVVLNSYSIITGIICLICMVFLFFESMFGICLGCLFYPLFYKEKLELCPGDSCVVKEKHEIQKVSLLQIFIFIAYAIIIAGLVILLYKSLSPNPVNLLDLLK